jgi:hypothetical protein
MAVTLAWEQVHDSVGGFVEGLDYGVSMTTEHALIAGLIKGPTPRLTEIYRSTNDGETWAKTADLNADNRPGCHRTVNLPDNIVVLPACDTAPNTVTIYRSPDAGLTWPIAHTYQGADDPPFRDLFAYAGLGYDKNSILLAGRFQSGGVGGFKNFVRSTDKGQTWEFAGGIEQPAGGPIPTAMTNGANGNLLCGTTELETFWSSDYGATWNPSAALSTPPGFFGGQIEALTWMTPQIVLCAASGNSSAETDWPYLYRSTNKGVSWTHIPKTDIASWPPHADTRKIWEIKRLTKDLAIFLCDVGSNGNGNQTRMTIDGGLTWPILPTGMSFPANNPARSFGNLIASAKQQLFVNSFNVEVSGAHRRIWKGTLTC